MSKTETHLFPRPATLVCQRLPPNPEKQESGRRDMRLRRLEALLTSINKADLICPYLPPLLSISLAPASIAQIVLTQLY